MHHSDEVTGTLASVEPVYELGDDLIASLIEGAKNGSALTIVQGGPSAGTSFNLEKDRTSLGRHPASDIFLDDVTVSRRHAEIVREGDEYTISDVGSLNGTYVNHKRSDFEVLKSGDEVQIGKYKLLFLIVTKD
ncbi:MULTISPECIES: FHA domain-containing protein [Acidithrix]|jgi:pSer/pThr/pTyr-binding forkhead associated (FHA) protein|nr:MULTISPECIES: FHA domain-containing protein [Acidithrix]CAG4913603.1 unnamed protein product [Acidithrix sp. C25]